MKKKIENTQVVMCKYTGMTLHPVTISNHVRMIDGKYSCGQCPEAKQALQTKEIE